MIKDIQAASEAYMELNNKFQERIDHAQLEQEKTISALARKLDDTIEANHTK